MDVQDGEVPTWRQRVSKHRLYCGRRQERQDRFVVRGRCPGRWASKPAARLDRLQRPLTQTFPSGLLVVQKIYYCIRSSIAEPFAQVDERHARKKSKVRECHPASTPVGPFHHILPQGFLVLHQSFPSKLWRRQFLHVVKIRPATQPLLFLCVQYFIFFWARYGKMSMEPALPNNEAVKTIEAASPVQC